jgi:polyhydroxyalkanoate synthesis regulator phasin
MTDITEKLRWHSIDWDGKQMPDLEPAKGDPTAGTMREAADEIERLREQVLALQHIADRDEERLERMRTYIVQLESAIIHLERVIFRLENK